MSAALKCDVCGLLFEKAGYSSHVYLENVCIVLACRLAAKAPAPLSDADVCPACLQKASQLIANNLGGACNGGRLR